jgi:hypothetical protein
LHLKKFVSAPKIKPKDKRLGELFYKRLTKLDSFFDRLLLYILILQYRNTVFYQKRRVVGIFSHVKHAYYWAFW